MDLQVGTYPGGIAEVSAESKSVKMGVVRSLVESVTAQRGLNRDAVETLIPDSRAELSPAQSVERKLTNMLRGTIPVSHIRLSRMCGKR